MHVASARHHSRIPLSGRGGVGSGVAGGVDRGDINSDADRQSARFFGIHKIVRQQQQQRQQYQQQHQEQHHEQHLEQQQQHQRQHRPHPLCECYVLLPSEGIVNIPFEEAAPADSAGDLPGSPCGDDGDATLAGIGRQLELQTGYTVSACRLLAGDSRSGGLHGATLSLLVLPAYQELLTGVQANSGTAVRAWLTAAAKAAPGGEARLRLRPVAHSGLVLACCLCNLGLVRLFLQIMPELANSVTKETGRTCLHYACYHELADACRLLLCRMCRQAAALRDCDGLRAADYASPGSPARILALKASASPSPLDAAGHRTPPQPPHSPRSVTDGGCRGNGRANRIRVFSFPMPGRSVQTHSAGSRLPALGPG